MRFFERVAELEQERVPFALAIVVSRRAPVSSHLSDRALVFEDGRMEGFVGGACSRDIVRGHGLAALRSGKPRLLHIRPEPTPMDRDDPGGDEHVYVPMSCTSEGVADVYVEPHLPARRMIVVGFTPVAHALARLAAALDYDVVRAVDDGEIEEPAVAEDPLVRLSGLRDFVHELSASERARTFAVVASLGHYDEPALDALLDDDLRFVGLVASRKRAARVFDVLAQGGRSRELLAAIRNPVGIDIGARTPGDVAISILAEIVATSATIATDEAGATASQPLARDPVCGMDVAFATARHRYELDDRTYYFCGAGCRAAFVADPAAALARAGTA